MDHFDAYYTLVNNHIFTWWQDQDIYSLTGNFPWYFKDTQEKVWNSDYKKYYSNLKELEDFNFETLQGTYKSKRVLWSFDDKW